MAPVFSSNERALRSANRRRLAMLIIAGLLLLGGSASGIWLIVSNHKDSGISNQVASVTIATGGFTPATVTVQKGQEVTITNTDTTSHRLTADQIALPNFDSVDLLSQGDSYTYTFEKAGTYHYYDPADPAGFTGTINVK
jgi:plastocyanin